MAGQTISNRRRMTRYGNENVRSAYVYGNVVEKPVYEPERHVRRPGRPDNKRSRQIRRNRNHALRMSRAYVMFLSLAASVVLISCVNYVHMQSKLMHHSANITALQQELAALREENNTKYNVIMDSVNLEEVREKAVNKLGMVYAGKDQVVEYANPSGDYVKKYEEIPENGVLGNYDQAK